jgi:hypothetical protein
MYVIVALIVFRQKRGSKTKRIAAMFEQVKGAHERIKSYANQTPVMTSRTLNQRV